MRGGMFFAIVVVVSGAGFVSVADGFTGEGFFVTGRGLGFGFVFSGSGDKAGEFSGALEDAGFASAVTVDGVAAMMVGA